MVATAELALVLQGKDNASGTLDKVKGAAGGLGKVLGDVGKIAGGLVLGAGILQAPAAIGGAISAASSLNETLSKSNTVFKDSGAAIEQWANGAAKGFGQSKQQALEAAGTFGNLFTQIGIGVKPAAEMSMQMTELASDFASFHNADITEVITAQTAAFRGEYDALQRFVPTINAAAVEQKALAMTGKETTKQLTIQEKALATHALMMEGAGEAMGDFDRTSDSLANRQRILSATFSDMQARIGQALLPVMVALAGFVLEKVIPAISELANTLQTALAGPVAAMRGFFNSARSAISAFVGALRGGSGSVTSFGAKTASLSGPMAKIVGIIRAAIPQIIDAFNRLKVYFDSDIRPAFENVKAAAMAVVQFFIDNWPTIETIVRPIMDQIILIVQTAVGIIGNVLGIIIDLIQGDFSGAWTNLKELVAVVWEGIKGTVANGLELIRGLAGLAFDAAKALGNALLDGIVSGLEAIPGLVADVGQALVDAIKRIVNIQVIDRINSALEFNVDLGIAGSIGVNPPDLPHLAAGGIVTRPTLALIGEQGPEAVVPLTRPGMAGMGNVTIIVQGSVIAERELMRLVRNSYGGGGGRGLVG